MGVGSVVVGSAFGRPRCLLQIAPKPFKIRVLGPLDWKSGHPKNADSRTTDPTPHSRPSDYCCTVLGHGSPPCRSQCAKRRVLAFDLSNHILAPNKGVFQSTKSGRRIPGSDKLPKFCRTFQVLCEGSSAGFLSCKPFRRTLLVDPSTGSMLYYTGCFDRIGTRRFLAQKKSVSLE